MSFEEVVSKLVKVWSREGIQAMKSGSRIRGLIDCRFADFCGFFGTGGSLLVAPRCSDFLTFSSDTFGELRGKVGSFDPMA
jgi:hypothetical protein